MRSKLFVPGSRPELFAKALAGPADALSFDLEDAVDAALKADARRNVAEFLRSAAARECRKTLIVRVNAFGSPEFEADVAAVMHARLDVLNLPKVESPDEIRAAVATIAHVERERGLESSVRLLVNVETPRGLRRAAELGSADARVAGLQLGFADLFAPHGIDRRDLANVHAAQFLLRMAAAEAGVFAYDAAFPDVKDVDGFRQEAARSRALGFWGKSCIHPTQVPLANEAFHPRDEDVAEARRVLDAARAHATGAFMLDGRMIDAPFIRRAEAIVATATPDTT
jgi:citrate lyase subunit beta/citryl-CoA lyase